MLHLASTHHGLSRTFLGELVMIVLNVPLRVSGRRRRDSLKAAELLSAAASVLPLASTDHVLPSQHARDFL